MSHDEAEMVVHLRRSQATDADYEREEVLVVLDLGKLPVDERTFYFYEPDLGEPHVGLAFDPLRDARHVRIVKGCDGYAYGGGLTFLDADRAGFSFRSPEALLGLLFPDGEVEVTYPCVYDREQHHAHFALREGLSLLSVFFEYLPDPEGSTGTQPVNGACMSPAIA